MAEYIPTEADVNAALDKLAKAWPVLAEHASHMDGSFNLAHSDLKRMTQALLRAVASHGVTLKCAVEGAWDAGYEVGCAHGTEAAQNDQKRREEASRCRDVDSARIRKVPHA